MGLRGSEQNITLPANGLIQLLDETRCGYGKGRPTFTADGGGEKERPTQAGCSVCVRISNYSANSCKEFSFNIALA